MDRKDVDRLVGAGSIAHLPSGKAVEHLISARGLCFKALRNPPPHKLAKLLSHGTVRGWMASDGHAVHVWRAEHGTHAQVYGGLAEGAGGRWCPIRIKNCIVSTTYAGDAARVVASASVRAMFEGPFVLDGVDLEREVLVAPGDTLEELNIPLHAIPETLQLLSASNPGPGF